MIEAKPFPISKQLVWDAYRRVKANDGAPGVDGQTVEDFECDLKNNLYRIWNRMSSGTYFPPPVLQVSIPKRDGGERKLGIPTVSDRIAQTVVKLFLEPTVEPRFHPDSYGYRPNRGAVAAVGRARERCWKFSWVLDLDIRSFFDSLDHDLVMRATKRFTDCRWVLLYVKRWLSASLLQEDGSLVARTRGTPQGGVISPLLSNMFLHLAFDAWMQEEHPDVPFERYADDVIVHCATKDKAERLRVAIAARLERCKLALHPQKTKVVYCKDANRTGRAELEKFDFLGFTFRPRRARRRDGRYFVSFTPAVSVGAAKTMRQTVRRDWRLARRTDKALTDLAHMFNPVLRGWILYYGSFYRSAMFKALQTVDRALVRWAQRKFKSLRGHQRRASHWLAGVRRRDPALFAHWELLRNRTTG
jgi:group II intron reverse transcriptase/maturase